MLGSEDYISKLKYNILFKPKDIFGRGDGQ